MSFGDSLRKKSVVGRDVLIGRIEKMYHDVIGAGRVFCVQRAERGDTSHSWEFYPDDYGLEAQDAVLIQALFARMGKEEDVTVRTWEKPDVVIGSLSTRMSLPLQRTVWVVKVDWSTEKKK